MGEYKKLNILTSFVSVPPFAQSNFRDCVQRLNRGNSINSPPVKLPSLNLLFVASVMATAIRDEETRMVAYVHIYLIYGGGFFFWWERKYGGIYVGLVITFM